MIDQGNHKHFQKLVEKPKSNQFIAPDFWYYSLKPLVYQSCRHQDSSLCCRKENTPDGTSG